MKRTHRNILVFASLVLAITTIGCSSGQSTQKVHRDNAKKRWTTARSGLSFSLAQQAYQRGQLDKAEEKINEAIKTSPNTAEYHLLAAKIYFSRDKLELAARTVSLAISLNEKNAASHYLLGVIMQRWQRYDAALKEYELSYAYKKDEVTGLLAVAEMLVQLDRRDEAIRRLEDKLTYFQNNAPIRASLAQIYMMKRDYKRAVSLYQQAVLLAPDSPGIIEKLAFAEHAAGQHAEAIYHFSKLLQRYESYKKRADIYHALGDSFVATGKPMAGMRVYLDLSAQKPEDVNLLIKIAQAAWLAGDDQQVAVSAKKITVLSPRRFEGHMLFAMLDAKIGLVDQAAAKFDRAASLAPTRTQPHVMKGMMLAKAGRVKEAAAAYNAALKIAPDDKRAKVLLESLTARQ